MEYALVAQIELSFTKDFAYQFRTTVKLGKLKQVSAQAVMQVT